MYRIGITGGVGSGKSAIIQYLQQRDDSAACMADTIANELILPGHICYEPVLQLLGTDILGKNCHIDRALMAAKIFCDSSLLTKVNEIIHPAVKTEVLRLIELAAKERKAFFFVEAALLIEDNYREILDDIWFIYSNVEKRIQRLKEARAYSIEKINEIMKSQMSDKQYFAACDYIFDNSNELEETLFCINAKLSSYSG